MFFTSETKQHRKIKNKVMAKDIPGKHELKEYPDHNVIINKSRFKIKCHIGQKRNIICL